MRAEKQSLSGGISDACFFHLDHCFPNATCLRAGMTSEFALWCPSSLQSLTFSHCFNQSMVSDFAMSLVEPDIWNITLPLFWVPPLTLPLFGFHLTLFPPRVPCLSEGVVRSLRRGVWSGGSGFLGCRRFVEGV